MKRTNTTTYLIFFLKIIAGQFYKKETLMFVLLVSLFFLKFVFGKSEESISFSNFDIHDSLSQNSIIEIEQDADSSLAFNVNVPWYKTIAAKIFFLAILSGVSLAVYLFLKRRAKLKALLAKEHRKAIELESLNNFKTRLLTDVTHELKTPLTLILGPTRSALKELPNLSKEAIRKHLEVVEKNGETLLKRINNILLLNKLEAVVLPNSLSVGNIVQFIDEIVASFQKLAQSKKIELLFETQIESLLVEFDKDKMYTIVSNLLSNALKFTDEEGRVQVKVYIKKTEVQNLCLEVVDTGIGIPAKDLPLIFNRFYQSKENDKNIAGSGVGLAVVKELIEILKGTIEAKNIESGGASFLFMLPVVELLPTDNIADENLIIDQTSFENLASLEEKPIVLIVDDEVDLRDYIASTLIGKYEILYAGNGKEACDLAIEKIPDLIILDAIMPVMDGFKAANFLKSSELTCHIPIVMITAKSEHEVKMKGLQSKINAYITKPFYEDELLLRVENLIQQHELLKKRYQIVEETNEAIVLHVQDPFLEELTMYIESQINNYDLEVAEICKANNISRTQLHRKLKTLTGLSTTQFVRNIRIKKAKQILKSTDLNITEIAYDCGFKTLSYFTRIFTKEVGLSPSEYRNAG